MYFSAFVRGFSKKFFFFIFWTDFSEICTQNVKSKNYSLGIFETFPTALRSFFFHFLYRFLLAWDFRWITEAFIKFVNFLLFHIIKKQKKMGKIHPLCCRESFKDSKTVFVFSETHRLIFSFILKTQIFYERLVDELKKCVVFNGTALDMFYL